MDNNFTPVADLTFAEDDDQMRGVYRGAEPFTGTALDQTSKYREITEYRQGRAHGRHEIHLADGTPVTVATYAAGECVESSTWYAEGSLCETYAAANKTTRRWAPDGTLTYDRVQDAAGQAHTRWYYPNGTVKQHTTAGTSTDYFAADGRLAMRVRYGAGPQSVRYVSEVLRTSYLDVLTYPYVEAVSERSTAEWYFFGWLWRLLKQDRPAAEGILRHLQAAGIATAGAVLARLPTLDLATFEPAMSFRIEAEEEG